MNYRFYVIRRKEAPGLVVWLDRLETSEVFDRIKKYYGHDRWEIIEQIDLNITDEEAQFLDALNTFEHLGLGVSMEGILVYIFQQGCQLARKYPTEDIRV